VKIRSKRSIQQFNSNFFYKFQAPNAEEFIKEIQSCSTEYVNNSLFSWGENSDSDKVPVDSELGRCLVKPSVDFLLEEIGVKVSPKYDKPWINLYSRGQYQEIHDHNDFDFASVFFSNHGDDFSNLYFYDRNSGNLSRGVRKIMKSISTYKINITAGDIIFFPGHMLHGVSPHKSDIVRKTFAINFNI
tara:strand:+ start:915 stop:1478 length:564 start_codon:yes stop_codon:yes gene_type:complete